jgi:hypothetical protein
MITRRNFRERSPVRHPVGIPACDLGFVLQITMGPGSHFVNYFGC